MKLSGIFVRRKVVRVFLGCGIVVVGELWERDYLFEGLFLESSG